MAGTGTGLSGIHDSPLTRRRQERQARLAWALVLSGFVVLVALITASVLAARSYLATATTARLATLQVVGGSGLLVQTRGQREWRFVTETVQVQEGDTIATGPGAVGWLTLFDGGTVEISEDSEVVLRRMRTSRFWGARKEFVLEPLRGTIYVGMAPHGDLAESTLRVLAGPAEVTMVDTARSPDGGSFLVEVQRASRSGGADEPIMAVRVGVLRGSATVTSERGSRRLSADEQTIVSASGVFGPVTAAVREMIRNGAFQRGLDEWVEYQDQGDDGGSVFGLIQRVPVEVFGERQVAVEFTRDSGNTDHCETGVQQQIAVTLRVHSSLRLAADIWIDAQEPPGGGQMHTEYPLILKLTFVDVQGQLHEWWHGFYIQPGAEPEPEGRATLVEPGVWRHVEFDLRNVMPLPHQISSLLVYSSGHSYRARVTNLSLTSNEAGEQQSNADPSGARELAQEGI
ncbi:MAG: hypothetical protein QJR03_10900 [Sphaerobacter sp.]|nr:hypothetical protein [Sphaerobacter sp.]